MLTPLAMVAGGAGWRASGPKRYQVRTLARAFFEDAAGDPDAPALEAGDPDAPALEAGDASPVMRARAAPPGVAIESHARTPPATRAGSPRGFASSPSATTRTLASPTCVSSAQ